VIGIAKFLVFIGQAIEKSLVIASTANSYVGPILWPAVGVYSIYYPPWILPESSNQIKLDLTLRLGHSAYFWDHIEFSDWKNNTIFALKTFKC